MQKNAQRTILNGPVVVRGCGENQVNSNSDAIIGWDGWRSMCVVAANRRNRPMLGLRDVVDRSNFPRLGMVWGW
jgi:hypothetical protein